MCVTAPEVVLKIIVNSAVATAPTRKARESNVIEVIAVNLILSKARLLG